MSTAVRRIRFELEEAERYVGVDRAERRLMLKGLAVAVVVHAVLLAGRLPDWGREPMRVDAPADLMKVQFLKPPAPPPSKPQPPKPETKKIARPDPTPDEPEPVVEEPAAPEPMETLGPVRVSAGQGPGVIKRVEPIYPPIARTALVQGTVVLDAIILKDGTVGEIKVLRSASPLLQPSAVDALKQWRFTPSNREVIMTLTVNYVLK